MSICLVITLVLGSAAHTPEAERQLREDDPDGHPYIANYLRHKADLSGLGNAMRIAVENPKTAPSTTRSTSTPCTRSTTRSSCCPAWTAPYMKSLWTPATRWAA